MTCHVLLREWVGSGHDWVEKIRSPEDDERSTAGWPSRSRVSREPTISQSSCDHLFVDDGDDATSEGTELRYTEGERARGRRLQALDCLVVPVVVAWYFLLASWIAGPPAHAAAVSSPVLLLQGLVAALGVLVFLLHTMQWPPKTEDDSFHCGVYMGRWIFLTRQCLFLQALHLAVSFLGAATGDAYLRCVSDGMTLCVSSMGWFVTIQYFTLVHNNGEFKMRCEVWAQFEPPATVVGLQLRAFMVLMHVPALPLAVADVLVLKRHSALLAGACSLRASAALIAFYCVFYLCLIAVNFKLTRYWPYSVLKELTTPWKWLAFLLVQVGLLVVFCLIAYGLLYVPQPWSDL